MLDRLEKQTRFTRSETGSAVNPNDLGEYLKTQFSLEGKTALLTGGVVSPLVIWLALVPAEAALTGGRSAVLRAGMVAALAWLMVVGVEAAGLLPVSRLTLPLWQVYACSVLAALMQAMQANAA